ncbi:hypothetical protein RRG08_026980 [Elysia crispata]|uniref:Uncharacterized protein n=1 Tax=Elysia crispata TaxID=231223 RepID=A0AAE1E7X4_9GAST|nr:hypothetical protein RRG08_026980 [Elysia crispata]
MCNQQCPSGKYGQNCQKSCNTHCSGLKKACSHIDGSCSLGCDPGYKGKMCNQQCPSGKYGGNCQKSCSTHCAGLKNACSHIDGSCLSGCDPGYKGKMCNQQCPSGKYGGNCQKSCSTHCAGLTNACSHTDGSCFSGCDPGYKGKLCNQPAYRAVIQVTKEKCVINNVRVTTMVINVARTAVSGVLETPVIMSKVAVPMVVRRVTKVRHVLRSATKASTVKVVKRSAVYTVEGT